MSVNKTRRIVSILISFQRPYLFTDRIFDSELIFYTYTKIARAFNGYLDYKKNYCKCKIVFEIVS